jgi:hypothetical protein
MATMEHSSTREKIRQRRLDRMRLGQAACDYVVLPSDPEIRVAIVPLTEADYRNVLEKVSKTQSSDDLAGMQIKDRVQAQEILVRAIREEHDLSERVYEDVNDLLEDFDVVDVDHVIDCYNEMCEKASPQLQGIPEEELENLKKALQTMDWNDLSGSAWYAARRFLSRIMPSPLLDNWRGSTSTSSLITPKSEDESTPNA